MIELCRLVWCGLIGLFRSRASLEIEILALRHQLNILQRKLPKRPIFGSIDRTYLPGCMAWLLGCAAPWRLSDRKPSFVGTAQVFACYWRWRSRPLGGRPKVPLELRQLIRDISIANPLWGAPRIHGELLKLGIDVGQTTVPSTWLGAGDLRARDGRRFFATMLTGLRRWTCSRSRRSHSDCCTNS